MSNAIPRITDEQHAIIRAIADEFAASLIGPLRECLDEIWERHPESVELL